MTDSPSKTLQRYDVGALAKAKPVGGGAYRFRATVARTGLQTYHDAAGRPIREYRDQSEVFAAESLESLGSVAVTVNHPPEGVDSETWRSDAVGHVSDREPRRVTIDGEDWIEADLIVSDAATLKRIEAGDLVEISMGYTADVVFDADPQGRYDAVQRNIRFNHAALLPPNHARAGRQARLRLDGHQVAQPETDNMTEKNAAPAAPHKVVVLDGAELEFGSQAHLDAVQAPLKAKADALQAKVDALTEQLNKLKADADPSAFEAKLADELAFRARAQKLLADGYDFAGKTRRQVMADAVGADKCEGKSDAYVEARFDLALEAPEAPSAPAAPSKAVVADAAPVEDSYDPFAQYKEAYKKASVALPAE